MIFNSIIDALNNRYSNTAWRQDKSSQKKLQNKLAKDKSITVTNPQSSRWQISEEDFEETNAPKNQFDSNQIADMQVDTVKEVPVVSTAVKRIHYDPNSEELKVQYTSGSTEYSFPKVPEEVITEFLDSPSKGKYMAYVIRPNYSTRRKQ